MSAHDEPPQCPPSEPGDALVHALTTALDLPAPPAPASLDALRRILTARIVALLRSNRALLLSILYRIDVAEQKVTHAFASVPPDRLPTVLADLMIERQWQKLQIRHRYSPSSHAAPPSEPPEDPS